ncbi:MAG: terminase small subunit [Oscillospiraceae bacterium]
MTQKEKLFCLFYVFSGDVKESAIKCGYKKDQAEKIGIRFLSKKQVREEIGKVRQQVFQANPKEVAKLGLWKIAFGDVRETISSVLNARKEDGVADFQDADLFCVSEIKLGKNDVTEIKLFDKIKALEALAALSQSEKEKGFDKSFFEALEKGAEGVFENEQ